MLDFRPANSQAKNESGGAAWDTAESSDREEQQGRFSLLFPSSFLFFVRPSRPKHELRWRRATGARSFRATGQSIDLSIIQTSL
jgi:hypothetical protein